MSYPIASSQPQFPFAEDTVWVVETEIERKDMIREIEDSFNVPFAYMGKNAKA